MVNDLRSLINDLGSGFAKLMQEIYLDDDASSLERNTFTMLLAQHYTMNPKGLASEYLDHFLSGKATPKRFEAAKLLREDAGVSDRIFSEVVRRGLGIKTIREKDEDSRMSLSADAKKNRKLITVFQKNFSNKDWQYALGTFNFDWEIIYQTSDMLKVCIWGENTYRWHPNSARISQFVHRAGDKLATLGAAANFNIVAIPTEIQVNKKNKHWLEMTTVTQTNPHNAKIR